MSVPKLDLAPKLKRPLSLWNPLDYLRLLYWVFYFPQALRWYVDTFGGGYIPEQEMNVQKGLQILQQNVVQRRLLLQGSLLTIIIPFLLCQLIEKIGIDIDWVWVTLGVLASVALNVVFSVIGGLSFSVTFGVTFGVIGGLSFGVALGFLGGLSFGVTLVVVTLGFLGGVAFGIVGVMAGGVAFGVVGDIALLMAGGVTFGFLGGVVFGVAIVGMTGDIALIALVMAFCIAGGVAFGIAGGVGIMRPENWLITAPINLFSVQNKSWLFPHVTSLPLPQLNLRIEKWLHEDWETSLNNINQLLEYSLQFIPVVSAVNKALVKIPDEQLIYRVTQLAQKPYDWKLVGFASASLSQALQSENNMGLLFFRYINEPLSPPLRVSLRLDTHSRATTAGFWYLHEKQPVKATEAFAVVRNLLYAEELFILSQNLANFQQAEEVKNIANLTITDFPTENLLRPNTWEVMNSLRRVVDDLKLIQQSASRVTKSLAYSRAIGELTEIIDNKANIPEAERELIVDIAINWKQSLERIGKEIGNVTITKPVRNPHIIGNPVTGKSFVGREDILRQLEELWITGNQLQSVVLYGHRRMGKTSILVNAANCTGAEIKVIYVNLQRLGAVSQGVAEVLMAISDEIATAFKIDPPDDDAFLKLPQRTFERHLKKVIADMSYRGLIIALDEFETIEELIQQGQIEPGFMGFLRGLVQMSPKIAFAFAGLHTLEEMTADYFQPFFASVIPIRVSFLNAGATKTILANPNSNIPEQNSFLNNNQTSQNGELEEEFLLDYTGEALDLIYSLTSGQPYLVQLIGFQLVRNYNDQVFEQGTARDNIFTVEDVNKVVNESLFQQGRYYFEGVWGQAAQDVIGQQEIITALAPHPRGLTIEELTNATGLDTEDLGAAIAILERHDVIKERNGQYCIIVELFRRWALTV
ncbi:MAG: ATP-binding protein [Cyanobacteria bacterium P01_F01_bin.143]